MIDETTLRVGNVGSEAKLEVVRDALDELGAVYEHTESDPEDTCPQTAYFQVQSGLAEDTENFLARLSEDHGFEAEIL